MFRFKHPSAPNTRLQQTPEQLKRTTTPGGISWKKALAISAAPIALLFGAAFQSPNSVPGQLQAIQAQLSALQSQVRPRKFYLTQATHLGATALSACAEGYHMASLWELHDTSNLRYDKDLGFTAGDAGFGPPLKPGWIRTGLESGNVGFIAGVANCNLWTSDALGDRGTVVLPSGSWDNAGTVVSPWSGQAIICNTPVRVWCVQD